MSTKKCYLTDCNDRYLGKVRSLIHSRLVLLSQGINLFLSSCLIHCPVEIRFAIMLLSLKLLQSRDFLLALVILEPRNHSSTAGIIIDAL